MNQQREYEFIKVAVLENAIEAQVLESILEERGIPYRIRSYHDTAFDGLFQAQKGWGILFSDQTHKDDILDIISHVRQTAEPDDNLSNT